MDRSATSIATQPLHAGRLLRAHCRASAGTCIMFFALVGGCAAPQRAFSPAQDPATLDDVSFLHYLATVPVVSVDEGMRAVLLLTDSPARHKTFEQRFQALHEHGAAKKAWKLAADQILDYGTLAFMLRVTGELPPSLNERLASVTGLGDRRYALKTCIYEGLLPHGLSGQPVTGGELLSALTEFERRARPEELVAP